MRRGALLLGLWLTGCGDPAAGSPPSGEAPGVEAIEASESPTLPTAPHGGAVLRVGPHVVEALFFEDGSLHAWVLDADAPRPSRLALRAEVSTEDGVRPVTLRWNPEDARFEGRADAGAAVGRFVMHLERGDDVHEGAIDPLPFRAGDDEAATESATPTATGGRETQRPAPAPASSSPPTTPRPEPATGGGPAPVTPAPSTAAPEPTPPRAQPETPEPPTAPEAAEPQTPDTQTPEPQTPEPQTPEPQTPEPEAAPPPEPDAPSERPSTGGRRVRPAPL